MNGAPQVPEELMIIRPREVGDKAFIYATWLRGLYYGNDWFTAIDKDAFMENYHKVIDNVLVKPSVTVSVASLPDDHNVVLGYSVHEPGTLHWVFIKQAWRRFGIAKMLIPTNIDTCTHLTTVAKTLKPKEWKFNPFKI